MAGNNTKKSKTEEKLYVFKRRRVLEFIASATQPVGIKAIQAAFKPSKKLDEQIERTLEKLEKDGRIKKDKGKYIATRPYADIAYAELASYKPGQGAKRHKLKLWGLPAKSMMRLTISEKTRQRNQLRKGDTFIIRIEQGKGFTRTATVVKKCTQGKPAHIQGYFNNKGRPFEAADTRIKTNFRLHAALDFAPEHRDVLDGIIPIDFKVDDPSIILLPDQGKDLETGADINKILARKYGLTSHSAENWQEAALILNRKFSKHRRLDLTNKPFFTIDPEGAKDLDDAVCIERAEGGYLLTVAVADPDEFVMADTNLDKASYKQGNTIYFPDATQHLYPEAITMKCSLLHGQERPVGYVESFFDEDGNLQNQNIGFGYIRSKAQLTYEEYYDLVAQNDPSVRLADELHQKLRYKFWEASRSRQMSLGFLQNREHGYFSHGFVETAMVLANQGIAQFMQSTGLPVPFRNNGPFVSPEQYTEMVKELHYLGFQISDKPHECNWEMLDRILKEAQNRGIQTRIEELISRDLLDRASYEPQNRGHFALGIPYYCHATSPLRRKADSYIWRGLRLAKGIKKGALKDSEMTRMTEICAHLNLQKQIEKDIQSDRGKYRLISTLKASEGTERNATILHINGSSVEILLSNGLRNRLDEAALLHGGWRIDTNNREIVRISPDKTEERLGRDGKLRGKITTVQPRQALWEFAPTPILESV